MKHDLKTKNFERKAKRVYAVLACTAMVMMVTAVPALAADDPLAVVNNLSEFIFSLIRAIGLILLGFGILQVGLSLKSHDPSQRANGMLRMWRWPLSCLQTAVSTPSEVTLIFTDKKATGKDE